MNRTGVGHVWFSIEAYPWHGNDDSGLALNLGNYPEIYTNQSGEEFTLLERIGIRGRHDFLIGRSPPICFDWPNASSLERALAGNTYIWESGYYSSGYHHRKFLHYT
jgi:hypothetical protein